MIDTDARGRAHLGKPSARFRVSESADGTLTLEPATLVSDLELRFLTNRALQERIAYMDQHPEELVTNVRREARRE